jgi:hypothetical protein
VIELEVADLVVIAGRTLGLDTDRVLDLAAMLQFLAINGWDVDPEPPGPVAAMVTRLAAGTAGITNVADMLAPRLRPSGNAASRVKEAPMRPRPALPLTERIKKATSRARRHGMFIRFTDRARRVIILAQDEARDLGHGSAGTEHLLLGLLSEGEGVAALVLESLGISLEEARGRVEEIAGRGQRSPAGHLPFTPPAKKVLELSLQEAVQLGHNYVGTEHILLSLLREGEGVAAQVLADLGKEKSSCAPRNCGWSTGGQSASTSEPSSRRISESTASSIAAATCCASTASSQTAAPPAPPDTRRIFQVAQAELGYAT